MDRKLCIEIEPASLLGRMINNHATAFVEIGDTICQEAWDLDAKASELVKPYLEQYQEGVITFTEFLFSCLNKLDQ